MNWKDLRIGKKLGAGFGVVLLLLALIGGYSYYGLTHVGHLANEAEENEHANEFILLKEIDHLKWMAKLSDLFLKEEVTTVMVQTDDHKCGFGKWLYGEDIKNMMAHDKELATLVEAIKEPHRKLHESAMNIKDTYVAFDATLTTLIAERWIDHLVWIKNLNNAIMTGKEFKGGLDPTKCAFGKWYHAYKATNPTFESLLKEWEQPHERLHKSAQEIVQAMAAGDQELANKVYREETMPALSVLDAAYNKTMAWIDATLDKQEAATGIFHTDTFAALGEVQQVLGKILKHFDKKAKNSYEQMHRAMNNTVLYVNIASVIAIMLGIFAALMITRGIVNPITKGVDFATKMSDGDLTQSLILDQKDEVGILAKTLNSMGSNLRQMFKDIAGGVETLSSSSTELSAISQQMSSGAEQTSGKSNTVASAAEEMSANMTTVAAAAEQASTNADVIASSAEEMTATINEIAQNTEKARTISGDAVSQTTSVSERVGSLGNAAQEISKVTETITEISEQTNLLALNATIEAARAGEAGKGFAVVANEIKELARQTAEATGEIKSRIDAIQDSTSSAITDIEQIPQVINDVNELVSTIATAVEEQSVTTKEIASNVAQASQGMQDVTENVTQSSGVAGDIAKDISEVNQAAAEMSNSSSQVNISADELSKLAEKLKEMVAKFKV